MCPETETRTAQVEATKGALWDAYAEVAIYMEILHVQVAVVKPAKAAGERSVLYVWSLPYARQSAQIVS